MRLLSSLHLILCLFVEVLAASTQQTPTVSVEGLRAVTAIQFKWDIKTDTNPGGLNLRVGDVGGSLVISSNYTRSVAGTVGAVSGTISIFNPGDSDLELSAVQAVLQQPAAGTAPMRVIAECTRGHEGHVLVTAGQALACPFADLLPNSSQAAVTVHAQAAVVGSGQLTSLAVTTSFVSSSIAAQDKQTALLLGHCAVVSDTFIAGHLFLSPGAVAAGIKMPPLGSAGAICETTHSLYKVTFGPYTTDNLPCGAYRVMNVVRANPLGGSQPPCMASNLVVVSVSGCPAPLTAAEEQAAPPAISEHSLSDSAGTNPQAPTDSIIFGPPVTPTTPSAARWNPYSSDSSTSGADSSTDIGTLPSTDIPAPMPAPAAERAPQAAGDEYYYTYEYEAQIPSAALRRSSHRRLMAGEQASLHQHQHSEHESSPIQTAAVTLHADVWTSQLQQAAVASSSQMANANTAQQMSVGVWDLDQMELLQQFGSSGLTGELGSVMHADADMDVNHSHTGLQQWEQAGNIQQQDSAFLNPADLQQAQVGQQPQRLIDVRHISNPLQHSQQLSWTQTRHNTLHNKQRVLLSRQLQQAKSALGPQLIAADTFYGPATTATAADAPSIGFNAMQVGFSVMAYSWQPTVTVTPTAVTLQVGQTAQLNYTVQAKREELPRRTILRGSLTITNPRKTALKLLEVAVEAPAAGKPSWTSAPASCGQGGTLASLLNSVITVPAQGQVTCTFSVSYPTAAPVNGVLFARAITDSGQQLVSDGFGFVRPAAEVPAAQAVKVGACALLSDTFLTSADTAAVLTPSMVPASGTKAPAAAVAGVTGEADGFLLCDNASYQYSVKLGPYIEGQCGQFMVISHVRLHPMNSSSLSPSSATAGVPVLVTGCAAVSSTAAGFPLAAAAVTQNTQSVYAVTQLAPLTLLLQTEPYINTTSYSWSITNEPTATSLSMQYNQTVVATFMVQYKRTQSLPGPSLSGTVTIQNPNLLDAVVLAQVQVELYQLGKSGPVQRVWADCPRGISGDVVVPGQLLGAGQLVCSWHMQLKDSGPQIADLFSSSDAKLLAVAVTTSGLEYISQPQPLSSVARDESDNAAASGACAALSNTFQRVGLDGAVLLKPSSSGIGRTLLPGSNGGGRAADIVCSSLSVSYGVVYGPLSLHQCGNHKTVNLAVAIPTTGTSPLASAASTVTIDVSGCPGASASLNLVGLQLKKLQPVHWNVTGSASDTEPAGILKVAVGQSLDVPFKLRYSADPGEEQHQLVGGIQVSSNGQVDVLIAQLLVEVIPLSQANMTAASLVTWTASCPRVNSIGQVLVGSGTSTTCTFQGVVPRDVFGPALVVARLQFPNGHQAASPAVQFDFSQQTSQAVTRPRCALVSDHFLMGDGLLQPSKSTRPAAVAGANRVCNSQTVGFVASFGPFIAAQCGQVFTVINLSRVSPIPASDTDPPISFATIVRVTVDGGCPGR